MWNKLRSNSGLILLAVLAAGIWTSNIQDFLADKDAPQVSATPSPLQGWPLMPDGELGRKVKALFPGSYADLDDAELGRRVKVKYPTAEEVLGVTPTAPPRKSAVDIYEQEQQQSISARLKALRASATARCQDGTFSYSRNRRGTCSWHGGVAEWYKR